MNNIIDAVLGQRYYNRTSKIIRSAFGKSIALPFVRKLRAIVRRLGKVDLPETGILLFQDDFYLINQYGSFGKYTKNKKKLLSIIRSALKAISRVCEKLGENLEKYGENGDKSSGIGGYWNIAFLRNLEGALQEICENLINSSNEEEPIMPNNS